MVLELCLAVLDQILWVCNTVLKLLRTRFWWKMTRWMWTHSKHYTMVQGNGGIGIRWLWKRMQKKKKKKADLVLSLDVVIVDAARACAMNALGKSVVKSDVPSACLPSAWNNGPRQDGALMGRSLYQKFWKKWLKGTMWGVWTCLVHKMMVLGGQGIVSFGVKKNWEKRGKVDDICDCIDVLKVWGIGRKEGAKSTSSLASTLLAMEST